MRWNLLLVAAVVVLPGAACSGSGSSSGDGGENGDCVKELADCEATCVGRYLRTCSEDKKSYEYEYCSNMICKNGGCSQAGCLEPGKVECDDVDPLAYMLCLETMAAKTPKACSEGERCKGGACTPEPCEADERMCGYKTVLTCAEDGSSWNVEECAEDQMCDPLAVVCSTIDPFCIESPLGAMCQDTKTAVECGFNGKLVPKECADAEVCVAGFCQQRVCEVAYETPDAGGTDAANDIVTLPDESAWEMQETVLIDLPPVDIPPLEKPAKGIVTIAGGEFDNEEVKFTSSKQALYIVKEKDLQVGMAKGALMLEIHFGGIEEGVVGAFTSDEPGSVTPWIWLNDGTTQQEEIQWKYQSIAFSITLDQFDPPGGRVIGTFSGTLEDQTGGPPLELIGGEFDVPRKQ